MGRAARGEPASAMTPDSMTPGPMTPDPMTPGRTSPPRATGVAPGRVGGQAGAAMIEWVGVALVLAAIAVAVLHSPLPRTVHCAVLANVIAQRGGGGQACGRTVPPAPGTGSTPADVPAPVAP
ncbi:MAG TPA: hypothetical protein VFS29_10375 [Motilibacteraceae bacterium]|nr:hypothetical protein [Motilibacteraceae bacterium]